MGKGANIRIQNKSTHDITVSVEDRQEIDDDGMDGIQGALAAAQQFPSEGQNKFSGRYQYIEGEKKFFLQKDGSFKLVVNVEGSSGDSVKLCCNASDWWFEPSAEEGGSVRIATDVEEEDEVVRIEVRIYNGFHTKSWMGELAESIGSKPLCRVGLPGTHDSGTYQWDEDAGASPDSDLTTSIQDKLEGDNKEKEGGIFSKIGSAINDHILGTVYDSLCKCQHKSIKEQLEAGIRYLDIRVAFHEDSGKFYTCHGVHCVDMTTVVEEINTFLNESPKEIVLIDINHLYKMDGHHKELLDAMLATLGDKVADFNQVQPQSTVGEYWGAGAQAVILYCESSVLADYNFKVWSHGCISAPWPNTNDIVVLHDKLKDGIDKRNENQFFVLQGMLTPDGDLIKEEIMSSNFSTSLESIARRVSTKIVDWVEDEWSEQTLNVVIVDFFEKCSMVPAIINWNRK